MENEGGGHVEIPQMSQLRQPFIPKSKWVSVHVLRKL